MKMAEPTRKSTYEYAVARREQEVQRRRGEAARQLRRRQQRNLLWVVLVLMLLIAAGWLFIQRSGSLSGRVLDATRNEPLKNVRISLDQTQQSPGDLTSVYVFSNVRPGVHNFKVEADGYLSQSQSISLAAGQALKLDVKLVPASSAAEPKGQLWMLGTQSPATLKFLSSELKEVKSLPIDGQPVDALVLGSTAYLADLTQNQIQVVNLLTGKHQQLALPVNSAPAKLLYSPGINQILVMNSVSKTLARLNPANNELLTAPDASILLPFSPRDIARSVDGSMLILGPELLGVLSSGEQRVGKVFALPGVYADRMRYDANSDLLLIPGNGHVLRVSPQSGDTETIKTGVPAGLIEILDSARFATAHQNDLTLFSLQGEKLTARHFDGRIALLAKAGGQFLVATDLPNRLYLLDPQSLETQREFEINGKPLFASNQSLK